jgi:hypothetical protein
MSRSELAEAVNRHLWDTSGTRYGLDAHTIARYERGDVRWPSAAYRAGLRAVLSAATDAELGFFPTRRGNRVAARHHLEPGVDLAGSLASHEVATLPPNRVGWPEVEQVRAITSALARSENVFGGGFSSQAASAQLRWGTELLSAHASGEVRRELAEAVGNLAGVVAHCAFDIGDYHDAHRRHGFALRCADEAGSC